VAAGGGWLGLGTARGSALYLSAEDDRDELHRRLDAILRAQGLSYAGAAGLKLCSLAGEDALLAAHDPAAVLRETPLLRQLRAEVAAERPRLVVLDTSANLFGGNENDRAQVRQFIGMLQGIALRYGCAVVLLAHPSLTGLTSGTGTSGSTAWNNSVRSRLYLSRIVEGGHEPDPDRRVLQVLKANYGRTGGGIGMTWKGGVFQADTTAEGLDALAAGAKAERVFLRLLRVFTERGQYVSASPSSAYAPSLFSNSTDTEGMTKHAFVKAMHALLDRGVIRLAEHGRGAKARKHLELAAEPRGAA
jgi:RecA-family ATPase